MKTVIDLNAERAADVLKMLPVEDRETIEAWAEARSAIASLKRPIHDGAATFGMVFGIIGGAAAVVLSSLALYSHYHPTLPVVEPCPVCQVCKEPSKLTWATLTSTAYDYTPNNILITKSLPGQICTRSGDATLCVDTHETPGSLPGSDTTAAP